MRVNVANDPRAIGRVTTAIGTAGGSVSAVDIVEPHADLLVVDITVNASDEAHAMSIGAAVDATEGAHVHKVSDPLDGVQRVHGQPFVHGRVA